MIKYHEGEVSFWVGNWRIGILPGMLKGGGFNCTNDCSCKCYFSVESLISYYFVDFNFDSICSHR